LVGKGGIKGCCRTHTAFWLRSIVCLPLQRPWWWTPLALKLGYIDDTITMTFWITGAVFSAVVRSWPYWSSVFVTQEGSRQPTIPKTRSSNGGSASETASVSHQLAHGLVSGTVRYGSGRCDRGRGHGTASGCGADRLPGKGWPARHLRARLSVQTIDGVKPDASTGQDDRRRSKRRTCTDVLGETG